MSDVNVSDTNASESDNKNCGLLPTPDAHNDDTPTPSTTNTSNTMLSSANVTPRNVVLPALSYQPLSLNLTIGNIPLPQFPSFEFGSFPVPAAAAAAGQLAPPLHDNSNAKNIQTLRMPELDDDSSAKHTTSASSSSLLRRRNKPDQQQSLTINIKSEPSILATGFHPHSAASSSSSLSATALSASSSTKSYYSFDGIGSALKHNLRVKQSNVLHESAVDIVFHDCYIFAMRCPFPECTSVFHKMETYQAHHINVHSKRDEDGRLINTKEAKWKCPVCLKVSASWYNYAAHVTMHDSCDAPWICALPPVNKKKFVACADGTLICGKRCSTKHNLIKHLSALHGKYSIVDLPKLKHKGQGRAFRSSGDLASDSSSISPSNESQTDAFPAVTRRQRKRSRNSTEPTRDIQSADEGIVNVIKHNHHSTMREPPAKRMKSEPIASLPVFPTGDQTVNGGNATASISDHKNFVHLLLEAHEMMEKQENTDATNNRSKSMNGCDTKPVRNAPALFSNLNNLLHSTPSSLLTPLPSLNSLQATPAMRNCNVPNFCIASAQLSAASAMPKHLPPGHHLQSPSMQTLSALYHALQVQAAQRQQQARHGHPPHHIALPIVSNVLVNNNLFHSFQPNLMAPPPLQSIHALNHTGASNISINDLSAPSATTDTRLHSKHFDQAQFGSTKDRPSLANNISSDSAVTPS